MFLTELFENLDRTGGSDKAVIGWGRGMGHRGHMMLASSVLTQAKKTNADPYFVISRTVGIDDPLQPDEKLAIYNKVFPNRPRVFKTATEEMPDLNRVLVQLANLGYRDVTVVLGADQKPKFQYLIRPDKSGVEPYKNYGLDSLTVISRQETGDPSASEEGPRATPMRLVLTNPQEYRQQYDPYGKSYGSMSDEEMQMTVWRESMSAELSDQEVKTLMMLAKQRMAQFAAEKGKKKKNK